MARPRTSTGTRTRKPPAEPQPETLPEAGEGAAAAEEPAGAATDAAEPEVVDGDAVEVTEDGEPVDQRPTLAEYEAARAVLAAHTGEGSDEYDAKAVEAEQVIEAAQQHGIRPVEQEGGTSVSMLPAIRDAMTDVDKRSALPPSTVLPSPKEWEAAMTMAREIAATKFVPVDLRNRPDEVLACILTGREIGIGAMESLRKIHMIDGRPAFAADLMLSQMRKGGLRIIGSDSTAERAWIKAKRNDTGEEAEVEWTMAEASLIESRGKRLVDKDNWKNYPADMLWARCVGRLARRLGSDLLGGMNYTAEEVGDFDDYEGSYASGAGERAKTGSAPAAGWAVDTHLLPNSIPLDAEFWDRIKTQLEWIDSKVNWGNVFTIAARGVWPDIETWKALKDDDYKRFCRRLSNSLTKIVELSDGAELISSEHIIGGFAFGFDGAQITLPGVQESAADAPEATSPTTGQDDGGGAQEATETPEEDIETTAEVEAEVEAGMRDPDDIQF